MEMNWSHWFRCESSFGLLLVPAQPGIFALAEEIVQPVGPYPRRMLAVFEVEETDDLARALSRLFAPASAWRQRLAEGRCYLRYAVAPDAEERRGAATALKNWLNSQREVAGQIFDPGSMPEAGEMRSERRGTRAEHEGEAAERCGALEKEAAGEMRSERRSGRAEHEGEAAQRCGALEKEAAGEMRSERRLARAEHEGEAAERCGALEENEAATVTERAVDRVSKAKEYEKVFPAGF